MLSFPADYLSCFPPQKSCQLWNNVEACVLSLTRLSQQLIISLKYSRQPLKSAQLLHWVLGPSTLSHSQDLCSGKRTKDRHDRWILRTLCDFPGWLCRTAFLFWLVVYRKAPKRKPNSKLLDFGRWWHTYECFSWNLWENFICSMETKHQTSKTDPFRAKETSIMNQMFFLKLKITIDLE